MKDTFIRKNLIQQLIMTRISHKQMNDIDTGITDLYCLLTDIDRLETVNLSTLKIKPTDTIIVSSSHNNDNTNNTLTDICVELKNTYINHIIKVPEEVNSVKVQNILPTDTIVVEFKNNINKADKMSIMEYYRNEFPNNVVETAKNIKLIKK